MGAVCCCLRAEDIEDYVNPNGSVYRNCMCLSCFVQNFLNAVYFIVPVASFYFIKSFCYLLHYIILANMERITSAFLLLMRFKHCLLLFGYKRKLTVLSFFLVLATESGLHASFPRLLLDSGMVELCKPPHPSS